MIALVAGTYRVTFTLAGFKTVAREGIVLTAQFTATVDAAMAVGGVEETVTVSGATPLIDVQATTQRRALTSELLNELPTGRSFQNIAILVPGVQMPLVYSDVGGSDGARWQTMTVHGSRDDQMPLLMNGMPFNNMNNSGGGYNHTLAINTGTVQEMTITTSGSTSEVKTSGVVANTVAKEGGNRFSVYFYGDFSSGGLQGDNLDDALRAKGLQSVDHIKSLIELNPTMGGPIVKDKLWFYGGFRYLKSEKYLANSYLAKDPFTKRYCNNPAGCLFGYPTLGIPIGTATLVPDSRDLTKQDFSGDTYHNTGTANLTWQIDSKNKANFFYHIGRRNLINDSSVTQAPEASNFLYSAPDYVAQASWTNPLTSKLLFEGGLHLLQRGVVVVAARGVGHPDRQRPEHSGLPVRGLLWRGLRRELLQHSRLQPSVQHALCRQLRDRQPRVQVRHAGHVGHAELQLRAEQLPVLGAVQRRTDIDHAVRVSLDRSPAPEEGARNLRAGQVDDQELHVQPWRAIRQPQRLRARADDAGGTVHRRRSSTMR